MCTRCISTLFHGDDDDGDDEEGEEEEPSDSGTEEEDEDVWETVYDEEPYGDGGVKYKTRNIEHVLAGEFGVWSAGYIMNRVGGVWSWNQTRAGERLDTVEQPGARLLFKFLHGQKYVKCVYAGLMAGAQGIQSK